MSLSCAQGLLLVVVGGLYVVLGTEPGLFMCKPRALTAVPHMAPPGKVLTENV